MSKYKYELQRRSAVALAQSKRGRFLLFYCRVTRQALQDKHLQECAIWFDGFDGEFQAYSWKMALFVVVEKDWKCASQVSFLFNGISEVHLQISWASLPSNSVMVWPGSVLGSCLVLV